MGVRVHGLTGNAARPWGQAKKTTEEGAVSTVVWIVMTLWVVGSIELLVRSAASKRSAVRVRERHIDRPNR